MELNQEVSELLTEKQGIMNNDTSWLLKPKTHKPVRKKNPISRTFVAIGHSPTTSLFQDYLSFDDKGYIKTLGQSANRIEGVFAVVMCKTVTTDRPLQLRAQGAWPRLMRNGI